MTNAAPTSAPYLELDRDAYNDASSREVVDAPIIGVRAAEVEL